MAAIDNEEYDVEAVRGYRNNTARSREEYLIKWAGFEEKSNSWVSAKDLSAESLELARSIKKSLLTYLRLPKIIDARRGSLLLRQCLEQLRALVRTVVGIL